MTTTFQDSLETKDSSAKAPPPLRWALATLSLSMLMPSLDTSIANVGLPTMARAFGASFQEVQWIILAYLLTITSLIVSVGRLGDLIGRRRLLLLGIGLFTGASLLCGAAPFLWMLIVARGAQGIGAAIMISLTMALVGEIVPKARTGRAMGLLGTMSSMGTTLGPSLGGLLIAAVNWRSIFLINVPLGALNIFLVLRYVPVDRRTTQSDRQRFDIVGTFVLAASLVAYALAMTTERASARPFNPALLLVAGLGAFTFVVVEAKAKSPLVRLATLRSPRLGASLAMSALVSTVIMSTMVVGPFYLSRTLGLNAAFVGLALSCGPLVAVLTGIPAGRIVDRIGTELTIRLGLAAMATGGAALSLLPSSLGLPGYLIPIATLTIGYALFQAANNTDVMRNLNPEHRGVISGLLSLARNLGLITGASVMGAVFARAASTNDAANASREAVAIGMRITFGVAAVLIIAALVISAVRPRAPVSL